MQNESPTVHLPTCRRMAKIQKWVDRMYPGCHLSLLVAPAAACVDLVLTMIGTDNETLFVLELDEKFQFTTENVINTILQNVPYKVD